MDEDPRLDLWINDAREHGIPAMLTGFVLLCPVLGVPFFWAALLLGVLGAVVVLGGARATFGEEPEDF